MFNTQAESAGGYMNSPAAGGSSQPAQKQGRLKNLNLVPCTVAQLLKADQLDDKFIMDGIELSQIVLVGLVRSANETTTRLDYVVDDMTGSTIEVRQFVDNDENTPDIDKTMLIRENIYIRVHGHLRSFGGKRSVVAFRIQAITDMNELTTHILETIHAHIWLTCAERPGTNGSEPMAVGQTEVSANPSSVGAGSNPGSVPAVSGQLDIGLNAQQQQVLNLIRSSMDEQGMNISVINDHLKQSMSLKVIKEAIEFLSSEGHIYSTVDDDHYKATDS